MPSSWNREMGSRFLLVAAIFFLAFPLPRVSGEDRRGCLELERSWGFEDLSAKAAEDVVLGYLSLLDERTRGLLDCQRISELHLVLSCLLVPEGGSPTSRQLSLTYRLCDAVLPSYFLELAQNGDSGDEGRHRMAHFCRSVTAGVEPEISCDAARVQLAAEALQESKALGEMKEAFKGRCPSSDLILLRLISLAARGDRAAWKRVDFSPQSAWAELMVEQIHILLDRSAEDQDQGASVPKKLSRDWLAARVALRDQNGLLAAAAGKSELDKKTRPLLGIALAKVGLPLAGAELLPAGDELRARLELFSGLQDWVARADQEPDSSLMDQLEELSAANPVLADQLGFIVKGLRTMRLVYSSPGLSSGLGEELAAQALELIIKSDKPAEELKLADAFLFSLEAWPAMVWLWNQILSQWSSREQPELSLVIARHLLLVSVKAMNASFLSQALVILAGLDQSALTPALSAQARLLLATGREMDSIIMNTPGDSRARDFFLSADSFELLKHLEPAQGLMLLVNIFSVSVDGARGQRAKALEHLWDLYPDHPVTRLLTAVDLARSGRIAQGNLLLRSLCMQKESEGILTIVESWRMRMRVVSGVVGPGAGSREPVEQGIRTDGRVTLRPSAEGSFKLSLGVDWAGSLTVSVILDDQVLLLPQAPSSVPPRPRMPLASPLH